MKKIMAMMLVASMILVASCAENEEIGPDPVKIESNQEYSENGNTGGGSGDTPPPGSGG